MMKLKDIQYSLLFVITIVTVFLASAVLLNYKFPVGWDVFYHLRVLDLVKAQSRFLPFDPNSAGGRVHTYPPAFYALLFAIQTMTGLGGMHVLRLLAPLLLTFTCFAIFAVARKLFGATPALAALLFISWSGIHGRFVITTMPEALGHFFIPVCLLCLLFFENLAPVVLFTLGGVHLISSAVFFMFLLVLMIFRRKLTDLKYVIFLFLFPLLWKLYIPVYNMPTWGIQNTFEQIIGTVGILQTLALPFLFSLNPYFFISLVILFLSKFSPLLPVRLPCYVAFPLSLAFANKYKELAEGRADTNFQLLVVVILLAVFSLGIFLFYGMPHPEFEPQDFEAADWISQNTAPNSTVTGLTDFTATLVLCCARRPTIIDGYSEGALNAGQRYADQFKAYAGDLFTARTILSNYNVKYIFTNELEQNTTQQLNVTNYALPCLFNATSSFVFLFR